ncbi:Spy/CpxP family protein refolding chaperone [Rhodoblastus sp.]|uniref:Spy/CpxP family protein refolding chaperone n=1 Tax=Rhodoblastus sp. TaxID=1962975 RepID=UPI003F9840D7
MKTLTHAIPPLAVAFVWALAAAPAVAAPARADPAAQLDKICGAKAAAPQTEAVSGDLEKALLLSDDQKKALQAYRDAKTKAVADAKVKLCADRPDVTTFAGGLAFSENLLETRLDIVRTLDAQLLAFYNGLNTEQKTKFDQLRQQAPRRRR